MNNGPPRLTKKKLDTIIDALNAGLAGMEGEGDLADVSHDDMESALDWALYQLNRRKK